MGASATFQCPSGNTDSKTAAYYVKSQGIKCKPCSLTATMTDKDPVAGEVWTGISWGPLMSDSGAMMESHVDGYLVYIVDTKGRKLPIYDEKDNNAGVYASGATDRFVVAMVDKVTSTTNC